MEWIKVLIIRASAEPGTLRFEEIPPALQALQAVVGGYIELVPVARAAGHGLDMYVNEEGRLQGLPVNLAASHLAGQMVLGDAFVCRHDAEGETVGLTDSDVNILSTALRLGGFKVAP